MFLCFMHIFLQAVFVCNESVSCITPHLSPLPLSCPDISHDTQSVWCALAPVVMPQIIMSWSHICARGQSQVTVAMGQLAWCGLAAGQPRLVHYTGSGTGAWCSLVSVANRHLAVIVLVGAVTTDRANNNALFYFYT